MCVSVCVCWLTCVKNNPYMIATKKDNYQLWNAHYIIFLINCII